MLSAFLALCLACSHTLAHDASKFDASNFAAEDVLRRDVVVIGGGASGTYGAIKVKDMGMTVAVVEKEAQFGGHVNTYTDPASGQAVDWGVQAYANDTTSREFFARFNITTITPTFGQGSQFVDFQTGQPVAGFFGGSYNLSAFNSQLIKYPDLSLGFTVPHPVPSDLFLPFGEYVEKYKLQAVVYTIFQQYWGNGDLLKAPTIYVFYNFNRVIVGELTGSGGGLTTHNNSELYGRAQRELGPSALMESTVVDAERPYGNTGVRLIVRTPRGTKLIIASQILMSAPLTIPNMESFGLDNYERDIFGTFKATGYYTLLMNNTGLPANFTYNNAAKSQPYNVPVLPAVYTIVPRGNGIFYAWYGTKELQTEDQVKKAVTTTVQRVSNSTTMPNFLGFSSHSPGMQYVPNDAISDGFYEKLDGLQGYRNTFYTGNALSKSGSVGLWNFTGVLVPKVVYAAAVMQ